MYLKPAMAFADLDLARRLERAEGSSCRDFAEARQRLSPEWGATWMECAGAYAVYDGPGSPLTQSFGLGLFEPLSAATLDRMEDFFLSRGADVVHEVSPLAGVAALALLCQRGYEPMELSSVLWQPLPRPSSHTAASGANEIKVRETSREEADLWASISARGWAPDQPEMSALMEPLGKGVAHCEHCVCLLGELDGEPGAAGAVHLQQGIALLAGASTLPEMRRRGLQAALLEARLQYGFAHGCDLAMMVTETGSQSQRNAERKDFRIAYTRTKWRLSGP